MNRFVPALLAAVSALAVSGFTAAAPVSNAKPFPSHSSATTNVGDKAQTDLLAAEVAAQRGDWSQSANLAEASYRSKPDVWNEFNLATAYQHTRRGGMSVPLYLDLVDRGQFARTRPIFNDNGTLPTPMLPYIADEAAHRLNQMGVDVAPQTAAASAALLAAE